MNTECHRMVPREDRHLRQKATGLRIVFLLRRKLLRRRTRSSKLKPRLSSPLTTPLCETRFSGVVRRTDFPSANSQTHKLANSPCVHAGKPGNFCPVFQHRFASFNYSTHSFRSKFLPQNVLSNVPRAASRRRKPFKSRPRPRFQMKTTQNCRKSRKTTPDLQRPSK